jgi:DNA-directed RNA polymerase specialized sigma24 family protein
MGGATDGVSFNHDWIDDDVLRLVRRKARQMRRQREFRSEDEDDLAQELLLGIVQRSHGFRSDRGAPMAFARVCQASVAASMSRRRCAQKRGVSVTVRAGDLADTEIGVGTHEMDSLRGEEAVNRRLDLEVVMRGLPVELRHACLVTLNDCPVHGRGGLTDRSVRRRLANAGRRLREDGLHI